MARLKAPSLKSVRLFVDNPTLGDAALPSSPISLGLSQEYAEVIEESGEVAGGVRISAGARSLLHLMNDARDPDPNGFFDLGRTDEPAAENVEAAPALESPLTFDPNKAYVVLSGLSASGKLSGAGEQGALRVGLEGSAELQLASCTAFDRSLSLREATDDVFEHFKTIFSASDLRQLRPQETLLLGYGGALRLAFDVSASCLGDAVAAGVQAAFGRSAPVDIAAAPTASLAVTAEITDGYRLYVKRGDAPGELVFSVRKAMSRLLGVEGMAGLKVEFRDAAVLLSALSSSLSKLTGLPGQLVDLALEAGGADELSERDQELVEKAVDGLKLRDPSISAWKALKAAVRAAEERARAVVPQKLTVALSYTWRRVTTHSHVARFRLHQDLLERHHASILRLDLEPLLRESATPGSGVQFDRFFGKSVQKMELGYGFCFGLNDFTFLKSWDTRASRYIWLRDLEQRVQVSFLGKRAYASTWLDHTEGHAVELDASMPRFSPAPPLPREFELGFHVAFTWQNRRFAKIASDVADHALLIGALRVTQVWDALEVFSAGANLSQQEGCATVSLMVPVSVAELVLGEMDRQSELLFPYALARALPLGEYGTEFAVRSDIDQRMKAYGPVWAAFFEHRWSSLDLLGKQAATHLTPIDPRLARSELDAERLWGWSVRGVARNFGGATALLEACDDVRLACRKLANRAEAGVNHTVFERSFKAASPLLQDRFGARAFAALLYLAAARQPGILRRVARKVSFTWSEVGVDRALEFKEGDETL